MPKVLNFSFNFTVPCDARDYKWRVPCHCVLKKLQRTAWFKTDPNNQYATRKCEVSSDWVEVARFNTDKHESVKKHIHIFGAY